MSERRRPEIQVDNPDKETGENVAEQMTGLEMKNFLTRPENIGSNITAVDQKSGERHKNLQVHYESGIGSYVEVPVLDRGEIKQKKVAFKFALPEYWMFEIYREQS